MLQSASATVIITNRLGSHIQGATVSGVAKYVRDDLEANSWYLTDEKTEVMLVSCDLGGLMPDFTNPTREAMAIATGLDPRSIIIGATHTGGPSVIPSNYSKPIDVEYLEDLKEKLVNLAVKTMENVKPSKLGSGLGKARIGYNRRCCADNGQHAMGRVKDAEFTGLEGPEDDDHFVLYAVDDTNAVTAVLHQNTCHPCTFYGADFYSADYPGLARRHIRESLGEIPVLFFNGAFGDIGQDQMDRAFSRPESKVNKLSRSGLLVAGETLRLIYETPVCEEVELAHLYEDLPVPVRLPSEDRLSWAAKVLGRVDAGEEVPPFDIVFAHGATLLQKRFGAKPIDHLPIHAIKIGDTAIITQPTELFCQFGLDIKRRSPFAITTVWSICDGYRGYCPTYEAIQGGGYSGKPIYWTRLATDAGYQITNRASALLRKLDMCD